MIQAYNRVENRWQWEIHPNLKVYLELTSAPFDERGIAQQIAQQRHYYLSHVDSFVDNIHHFVEALELDAEAQNRQLRLIQLVALMLTLFVALVSIYLTKRTVLNPLKDLLVCARAARRGDFSVRSHHSSEDELGQLGDAFNVMAADLSKLYEGLEARVREKTLNLERSN
ncbi:HAMP domain-containing protein, partial [endosymbiont of Ridgeia piscesae]